MKRGNGRSIIASLVVMLLAACSSSGGSGGSGTEANINVTAVTPAITTLQGGHSFALNYQVSSDASADDTIITLYLVNKQEYDQAGSSSSVEHQALLGADTITTMDTEPLTRYLTVSTPGTLPDGDYYIEAYVNEHRDTASAKPNFHTAAAVSLSNANANLTNLRIKSFTLEKTSFVLDPWTDAANYLNANPTTLQSQLASQLTATEAAALLARFNDIQTGIDNPEGVTSSLLVAGAVAGNLRQDHPADAKKLNGELANLLDRASNPEQQKIVLTALGNSRDEQNVALLASYMNDRNLSVRLAAVGALGKYDGAEPTEALLANLRAGQDDSVATTTLKSLRGRRLDQPGLSQVGNVLLASPNEDVRRQAILLLSENKSRDHAGVRSALKTALQTETSRQNMRLIVEAYAQ